MSYKKLLFFGFLLVLLIGCHSDDSQQETTAELASEQTVAHPQFDTVAAEKVSVYQCGDALEATSYTLTDSTWLFLPDTTLKMPRLESASGVKYKAANYLYWTKGEEALLQLPKGSLMSCRLQPKQKPWAAAKLRGVDFRAAGQEPGWLLEITEDEQIKYVGNYGQDTLYTPVPEPTTGSSGNKIYDVQAEAHSLTVEIRPEPCTDVMSGVHFPKTVHIQVDKKKHKGCGKTLTN